MSWNDSPHLGSHQNLNLQRCQEFMSFFLPCMGNCFFLSQRVGKLMGALLK